jgi:formylglycine-generating enzyme required for sulfatase activity
MPRTEPDAPKPEAPKPAAGRVPASQRGWFGERMPRGMHKGPKRPYYFWDTGKGIALEMVYVPPGEFIMGVNEGEDPEAFSHEGPRHKHLIPYGYYIGRYETTWREYRAFCQAAKRRVPDTPSYGARDDYPIANVDWQESVDFCTWAGLALPTEAEWEKASRGIDGRKYPWGNAPAPAPDLCHWEENPSSKDRPVTGGTYPKGVSPFGACEMSGNMYEWCADWYQKDVYKRYARGDTKPPETGTERVKRSGCFWNAAVKMRCARRDSFDPSERHEAVGFRPVKRAVESGSAPRGR